ncbi:MAG: alpha/beta hydrolase [Bacteroidetes bacterium]|nr:alpha/beta hydrolase [Bacteroidota bacterium]
MNKNRYQQKEMEFISSYGLTTNEHFISISETGKKVRVLEMGSGPALLCIHGNPNAGLTWLPLVSELKNFRCLLLDRPGCGLSDEISYKNLGTETHTKIVVNTIEAVLDYFKLRSVNLLGSSNGSDWTLLFALHKPERVMKMIHEGCPGFIEDMLLVPSMKMMDSKLMLWMIPRLPSSVFMTKSILKQIGHSYSVNNNKITQNYFEWYVTLANSTRTIINDFAYSGAVYTGGKGKIAPSFIISNEKLKGIRNETLVLWGTDDPFGGDAVAQKFTTAFPVANLKLFANSGHLPWLDQPLQHAKAIAEFLSAKAD